MLKLERNTVLSSQLERSSESPASTQEEPSTATKERKSPLFTVTERNTEYLLQLMRGPDSTGAT